MFLLNIFLTIKGDYKLRIQNIIIVLFFFLFFSEMIWAVDYYPLHIGNKWVYERRDREGFDIYEIIDTTAINGRCYYKFVNRSTVRDEIYYFYRRIDSLNQIVEPIYESAEEYIRYKVNVVQGTYWIQYPNQFTYKTTLEDTSRSVTTPIGTFYPCYFYTILIVELNTDFKEWLAPDLGLIRDESEGQSRILMGALINGKLTGDTTVTKILEEPIVKQPIEFELKQNFPNPFNSSTIIPFSIQRKSKVNLQVYNIHGQLISMVFSGIKNSGKHVIKFDSGKLGSGLYMYRIQADNFVCIKKMLIIK